MGSQAEVRLVIVTGLSGAGKTQAIKHLEDLGFFCVDNLPPALLPKMAELAAGSGGRVQRIALGIDLRGGDFFHNTVEALAALEQAGFHYQILFLEADEDALVRRFKESRRPHPLGGAGRILEGIREERRHLEELRGRASYIINTTALSARELQAELTRLFASDPDTPRLQVFVVSFGFKHGLPLDADLVFDVRFLPNPFYVESLRPLTGIDPEVREYVLRWPLTRQFMHRLTAMLDFLLPQYIREGKAQLVIAIGCTGGRHRSVVVSDRIADLLRRRGYSVHLEHRDCGRIDVAEADPRLPPGGESVDA